MKSIILYVIFGVGAVLHLLPSTLGSALSLTPFLLVAVNLVIIFLITKSVSSSQKFTFWIIVTYLFTLTVEIIGVKTGFIFGAYEYGDTLGWELLGVPLVIGLNWVTVVLGALTLCRKYITKTWLLLPTAATVTVVFDWIMEPVAIKFDYWQWQDGVIPLQNYIAWFCLSLIAGLLFARLKLRVTNYLIINLLIAQTIFFIILNLF